MINATISKVLVTRLLDRLIHHYENLILSSQFGFRINKSTTDAIFVARQMLLKGSGQIYGCLIDLTAAPSRVIRVELSAYGEQAYDLKSYTITIILYDFLDFFFEAYDFLKSIRTKTVRGTV